MWKIRSGCYRRNDLSTNRLMPLHVQDSYTADVFSARDLSQQYSQQALQSVSRKSEIFFLKSLAKEATDLLRVKRKIIVARFSEPTAEGRTLSARGAERRWKSRHIFPA